MDDAARKAYNAKRRAAYHADPERKSKRLAQCRAWNAANRERRNTHAKMPREKFAAYMREWRKKHPPKPLTDAQREAQREASRKHYRRSSPDQIRAKRQAFKRWRINNLGRMVAHQVARQSAQENRTPAWLTDEDIWLMNEVYDLAAQRRAATGVQWHVDHIVPLRGRYVSGLHVPSNLQVITAAENIRKHNLFDG